MPFPVSPNPGDSYTDAYGTVWIYAGSVNGWYRQEVIPGNETTYTGGGSGSATATGAAGEIQFTDGTNLAASPNLLWDDANDELEVTGDLKLLDGGSWTTTLQTITPTQNNTISLPNATGTVALVAGSSGQPVYNNAGAYAGLSTAAIGATGNITLSLNGASGVAPVAVTGSWFAGTTPQVLIQPSNVGTAGSWSPNGTGIGVNAISTFTGRLLDLQVNGTSFFKVKNNGDFSVYNTALSADANNTFGVFHVSGGYHLSDSSNTQPFIKVGGGGTGSIQLRSDSGYLGWGAEGQAGGTPTLILARDAANTLAQRNGTSAQTYRVYNTYTSSTNYELGKLEWNSNAFRIGTEKGSGGGTARALELQTDGTTRATVDTSGRLLVGTSSSPSAGNGQYARAVVQGNTFGAGGGIFNVQSSIPSASIAANDDIGFLQFTGNDGNVFAAIRASADASTSVGDFPGRLVFSTTADGASSPTERLRITNDGVLGYNQAAPVAVDATATLTVANLKTGIITSTTAAAVTMTLPTGTLTEGGFTGLYNNCTFEWTVINTGATNAVTVQGDTGHTLVGSGTVAAGVSGRFASRRTAANTFVTYRLS